jgi:hypothetical protein
MKLLIMQFSPTSCHFISVWFKNFPQHPALNTLSLCSSLNVRDQISHPYRTTSKIIVLYILIFMFLDSRREASGLNDLASLVSIKSSSIQQTGNGKRKIHIQTLIKPKCTCS